MATSLQPSSAGAPLAPMAASKLYTLMVHTLNHSQEDLILNKDVFSDLQIGDFIRVFDPDKASSSGPLILKVNNLQSTGGRLEISISKSIADSLNLKPFTRIAVEHIDSEMYLVDFVELAFRRQFLSRGNMFRFKTAINGKPVYVGQTVLIDGVQAQVQELGNNGAPQTSGIICERSKFIFRSRSARIIWLVQISKELWEFDERGDLYFEKFLTKFVDPVLEKWKQLQVSHQLSVIFFARSVYLDRVDALTAPELATKPSLQHLNRGLKYQDFFKVVIENTLEIDKVTQLKVLKQEFWSFCKDVGWKLPLGGGEQPPDKPVNGSTSSPTYHSVPSDAYDGNFLEAINTTLNLLDKHYMDRDLQRTGNSIVLISAGTGIFDVQPQLSQITKQRMMDTGIGIDFVSLSQPPLHAVPLFHVNCHSEDGASNFYEIPHWINISYVDCQKDSSSSIVVVRGDNKKNTNGTDDTAGEDSSSWPTNWSRRGYRWSGLDFVGDRYSKDLRDEAWGTSFTPLPFTSVLRGHINTAASVQAHAFDSGRDIMGGGALTSFESQSRMQALAVPTALKAILHNTEQSLANLKPPTAREDNMKAPVSVAVGDGVFAVDTSLKASPTVLPVWGNGLCLKERFSPYALRNISAGVKPMLVMAKHLLHGSVARTEGGESSRFEDEYVAGSHGRLARSSLDETHMPVLSSSVGSVGSDPGNHMKRGIASSMDGHSNDLFMDTRQQSRIPSQPGGTEECRFNRLLELSYAQSSLALPDAHGNAQVVSLSTLMDEYDGDVFTPTQNHHHQHHQQHPQHQPHQYSAASDQVGTKLYSDIGNYKKPIMRVTDNSNSSSGSLASLAISKSPDQHIHNNTISGAAYRSSVGAGYAITQTGLSPPSTVRSSPSRHIAIGSMHHQEGTGHYDNGNDATKCDGRSSGSAVVVSGSQCDTLSYSAKDSTGIAEAYQASHLINGSPVIQIPVGANSTSTMTNDSNDGTAVERVAAGTPRLQTKFQQSLSSVISSTYSGGPTGWHEGNINDRLQQQHQHQHHQQRSSASTEYPNETAEKRAFLREYRRRAQVNPFRKDESANYLILRSHNRRRWSHVFPSGNLAVSHVAGHTGLNWKSLSQPAILPLTTDYLPSASELISKYDIQTFYSLEIFSSESFFKSIHAALIEMVCHRLSMEFQLVEGIDKTSYYSFLRGSKPMGARSRNLKNGNEESQSVLYILSMGHRIQFLEFDATSKQIHVTLLRSRQGINDSERTYSYYYELFVPALGVYKTVSQRFSQFPTPEYRWNKADGIIIGTNGDEVTADAMKTKRLRFALIPERSGFDSASQFFTKIEKLTTFFNKYCKGTEIMSVDYERLETVNLTSDETLPNTAGDVVSTPELPQRSSSSIPRKKNTCVVNIMLKENQDQPKWAFLKFDRAVYLNRVFHVEIHWIACDSWLIDDLVNVLFRRCTTWGLRIIQIPEYFCTDHLQVHPFRALPFFPASMSSGACLQLRDYPSVDDVVASVLLDSEQDVWVPDDDQLTNWDGVGDVSTAVASEFGQRAQTLSQKLAASFAAGNGRTSIDHHQRIAISRQPKKQDRQWMHRMGLACVRAASVGFVWLMNSGAKVSDINTPVEEKRMLALSAMNEFQRKCQSVVHCYEILIDILEEALVVST